VNNGGEEGKEGPPLGQPKPRTTDCVRLTTYCHHHNENQGQAGVSSTLDPRLNATTAPRQPAGRSRLQASAAHPGKVQSLSRGAGAFAAKGIPSDPMARRSEIGCSTLQPERK